jgi:hypothetical protein
MGQNPAYPAKRKINKRRFLRASEAITGDSRHFIVSQYDLCFMGVARYTASMVLTDSSCI